MLLAFEIPAIEDFSHWGVRELNPPVLQEGLFYYGIVLDGKVYISTLWEKEAQVGKRAGGHFKLLMGAMRDRAKNRGMSEAETEKMIKTFYEMQAKRSGTYHNAKPFGFKPIRDANGQLILKWHGFNSFKSTINATTFDKTAINVVELATDLAKKYNAAGHHLAHPISDQDLILNPKYLDLGNEVYRGPNELWRRTDYVGKLLRSVNEALGYSNWQIHSVMSANPALTACSRVELQIDGLI